MTHRDVRQSAVFASASSKPVISEQVLENILGFAGGVHQNRYLVTGFGEALTN
jgi:hypothetical protein